jgi:CDP-paratose 2-epimerase
MKDHYLITGGAGFIGTNIAHHYLAHNKQVTILDDFSRPGAQENIRWLRQRHGDGLTVVKGDVRQLDAHLPALVETAEVVFHLAAQVAVTRSVNNPREDFEVNAFGTFNVLEAVRLSVSKPIVVYSSTNKVYGKMADLAVLEQGSRYGYAKLPNGIPETRPLDFYSPYGCSKGIGDQYVLDYARIYGLKAIVFRQSCIYGPHQFGIEDQGWIAWLAIRAIQDLPITIYGDGKQVRDVLYIDDLIAAYNAAIEGVTKTTGQAYNIGGGPRNTLSLLELIDLLKQQFGRQPRYDFADWRPGDQLVYISDIRKARVDFGWVPRVSPDEGVAALVEWLHQNEHLFAYERGNTVFTRRRAKTQKTRRRTA